MVTPAENYDVIIAGGGPAGTSAAIQLATHDFRVLLVEQKQFPRAKLCGEFISPECLPHFGRLGVAPEMQQSNPSEITETVFYSRTGRRIVVPSGWFGGGAALGLSRATMDDNLLRRAQVVGVDVRENSSVNELLEDEDGVHGIKVKTQSAETVHTAPLLIDATGRSRALFRKLRNASRAAKPRLVAFKAHFEKTRVSPSACEIYSYPGGYGGLSLIENGISNLCFIVDASEVRRAQSTPEVVLRQNVMLNRRAGYTLREASPCSEWLSVALESFGGQRPSPVNGLLGIGDSAAFIDPFTGSGMLMAFESAELAAQTIVRHLNKSRTSDAIAQLCSEYNYEYIAKFNRRLRVCNVLRHAAFSTTIAELAITVCGISDRFRGWLAGATRSGAHKNESSSNII